MEDCNTPRTVILQIQGKGAYRVPMSDVEYWYTALVATPDSEFYIVDNCGRTWAPLANGEYCLWEDNPPAHVSYELPPGVYVHIGGGLTDAEGNETDFDDRYEMEDADYRYASTRRVGDMHDYTAMVIAQRNKWLTCLLAETDDAEIRVRGKPLYSVAP